MNDTFKRELASFPSPFLRAIQADNYTKGESQFSTTQLLSPPQRTWLATLGERHQDPYGSFMALLGTAVHYILESNVDEANGEIAERRLFMEIMGVTISGMLDFYENATLFDYKITGGIQDKAKPEHYMQVQINAYLARQNGLEVTNVAVVYIMRDWSYMRSTLDPTYPQSPFKIFVHPYEEHEAVKALTTCVAEHLAASLGEPRECTPSEKWQKPDSFALMKVGGKRASKVCDTLAEAQSLLKPGQFIETRKGECTYCNSFCGYSAICPQFARESRTAIPTEP